MVMVFFHMSDGKFIVLDADSDDSANRYKGMINGSLIPAMYMAETRPEIYVLETGEIRLSGTVEELKDQNYIKEAYFGA